MGTNKAEEKMTREQFIMKYLGNSTINWSEEHCDMMRNDLDKVINYHDRQSEIDELTNEVERLRKESEWISIKDELPIIGKGFKHFSDDVLCLLIDESCTVTFYDYELKKWNLRPHSYEVTEVTHWKPLPPIHGSIPSLSTII